ncbi:Peroxidase [Rhynchospora pubera]|uniref:L-ascorbate peroxidase n=1 Tax=Rhynchospora pubera TaxID=906938 RepID=A0AAV8GTV6_9POAL|nr:Peroxidase [Rhynchospora pubera]
MLSMASMSDRIPTFLVLCLLFCCVHGQMNQNYYQKSCPNLQTIVQSVVSQAIGTEARMGASLLPTVSCADIVALAARDSVNLLGGPTWNVVLGRKDARTASLSQANSDLPGPGSSLSTLISMFNAKNLSAQDMTVLSGAHTIGQSRCFLFRGHIYNDTNINANFAAMRQQTCPFSGNDSNLAPIDVQSPVTFDNAYYVNLVNQKGLFHSDQELFNGGSQDSLVQQYSTNSAAFSSAFAKSMVRLGDITPLTGQNGEIRLNCRTVN